MLNHFWDPLESEMVHLNGFIVINKFVTSECTSYQKIEEKHDL